MEKSIRQNSNVIYLLKGLLFSYIITAFILLILSFLMLKMDLSGAVISGGINFTYVVSAFAGGFFVGKKTEHKKFLWGLIMGVVYFVVLMLISLLMNQGANIQLGKLLSVLVISGVSGMLGGMIS